MLTPQQIQAERERLGIKSPNISSRTAELDALWGTEEKGTIETFASGVGESFQERTEKAAIEQQRAIEGKISPERATFRTLGEGAGAVGDIGFEILKLATPKFLEDLAKKGVEKIGQTEIAQALAKKYTELKEKHPEATKDFEAVFNIASIIPVAKVVGVGVKQVGKVAFKTLQKGEETLARGALEATAQSQQSFVRNLIRPEQTKAVKEAQVGRTTETGTGIFKKSEIEPTARELRSESSVLEVKGVSAKNTFQRNYNLIKNENVAEAKRLTEKLAQNDFAYPRKELVARLRQVKEELARNPVITGDAEKTAEKLIAEIERRINAAPSKGSELLKIRKEFDQWVENQKGGNIFDPSKENAFSVSNRAIRRSINDFLDEKAPNVEVKKSLQKQSALYDAMDNIGPKAAIEANTAMGRFFQRMDKVLGTKNKAVQILAATVGIGGLGAASTFAPGAAVIGVGGYLIYRGGKLVMSPKSQKAFSDVLGELRKAKAGEVTGGIVGGTLGITPTQLDELLAEMEQFQQDFSDEEWTTSLP